MRVRKLVNEKSLSLEKNINRRKNNKTSTQKFMTTVIAGFKQRKQFLSQAAEYDLPLDLLLILKEKRCDVIDTNQPAKAGHAVLQLTQADSNEFHYEPTTNNKCLVN